MRVLHLGNLTNNGYKLAKFQRRLGVDARLVIHESQIGTNDDPAWEDAELRDGYPDWITIDRTPPNSFETKVARWSRRFAGREQRLDRSIDIVHAQCTAPILAQFAAPDRLVSHCLGSDLRELATSRSLMGHLQRRAYRKSRVVFFNNVDHVNYIDRLNIRNGAFLGNPLDLERIAPKALSQPHRELVVFHPTSHDWTYRGGERSSTKGNDRLIRAFARFVRQRPGARLLMLKSGIDQVASTRLVTKLNIGEHVEFLPRLRKSELIDRLNAADVIADQFDLGAMGGVALEALAIGKPLLSYLKEECAMRCYSEPPPLLNARTEDEILAALCEADAIDRAALGAAARAWIERHHDWRGVTERVIETYHGAVQ